MWITKSSLSLCMVVSSFMVLLDGAVLPPNHPMKNVLHEFGHHIRCPHANEWLTKGPEQAALDLGLTQVVHSTSSGNRKLDGHGKDVVVASCNYMNPWSNSPACIEMRGSLWTTETMQSRCDENSGTLTEAVGCEIPPAFAGWCVVGSDEAGTALEANPLSVAGGMGCSGIKGLCEGMMSGQFEFGGDCVADISTAATTAGDGGAPMTPARDVPGTLCEIGLGPIGAAHQAGYADGYLADCPGTPAEGSPYQWPLAWSANVEGESMAYGSDEVVYHSKGTVYYRLDKNWKRSDTTYQKGVSRFIFQGDCDSRENNSTETEYNMTEGCDRDSDVRSTMIHRGSKMFFISWKNGTANDDNDPVNIETCRFLTLGAVGNMRPDWYMDARGDATDVQYLGDQHVYYEGKPRLAKQWRKTDFANMYFVMSMLANPGEDGMHWPLILNIPGEGFGDDTLQHYSNHSILTDDDDYMFLLDEAFELIGGTCEEMNRGADSGGPPEGGEMEHIPSNLEVETHAWFHNEYTFSPVWKPQPTVMSDAVEDDSALTEAGIVEVRSCFNASSSTVDMTVTFNGVLESELSETPWIALGYRKDEQCLMLPKDGGNNDIILITAGEGSDAPVASFGPLLREVKSYGSEDAVSSLLEGLVPLKEADGFSEVELSLESLSSSMMTSRSSTSPLSDADSVTLTFKQGMESGPPEVMHLMYAVGNSPQMGYHSTRMCFEVTKFPFCEKVYSPDSSDTVGSGSIFEKYTNGESIEVNDAQASGMSAASTHIHDVALASISILFTLMMALSI